MRQMAIIAALLSLLACATPPQNRGPEVSRIEFLITSWGSIMEHWSIDATGSASLEIRARGVPFQQPLTPQVFSLTPAEFQRIQAALASAERFAGRNFYCSDGYTDAPQGSLAWKHADGSEGVIRWDHGCVRPNRDRDALFERTRQADEVFHEMTGTQ